MGVTTTSSAMNVSSLKMNLATLTAEVIALARRAGNEIMTIYRTDFDVSDKEDNSPLTAADMASHRIICEGLAALTPELPILSEESATIPFAERRSWQRYWLVDPLDGTKEFIKRNGEFTVNIALIENHTALLGVVQIPAQDRCYYGIQGAGAFCQQGIQAAASIHVTRPQSNAGTGSG